MKVVIDSNFNLLMVEFTEETAKLLYHLLNATVVTRNWDGGVEKYEPVTSNKGVPEKVKVTVVPDSDLDEPSPALDKMAEAVKAADAKWYQAYTKANEAAKEIADLKEKLAKVTQVAAE